ncbi:MAG: heavy-metal-associated domain-containing protein [Sphaerochaetaceae bacterium]|jgi:copper chaperone CopZ|nr:heavy-metal-associated domain-containing protein [Sphaerochaetaceae bacterium]
MIIKIEGMMCNGCERRVQKALGSLEGVISVKADHEKAQASLEVDKAVFSAAKAKQAVEDLGYSVVDVQ